MNKKARSLTLRDLTLERDALVRRLREGQRAALGALAILQEALEPETHRGAVVEETASEQVERSDRAIRTVVAWLARVVDPDALTLAQAELTAERLGKLGLFLDGALPWEREESVVPGTRGLLVTLKQLVSALRLHQDLDRCCCAEMGGEQCLFCTTEGALVQGKGG